MLENIFTPRTETQTGPQIEPELHRTKDEPKGVLQKNLKLAESGVAASVPMNSRIE